MLKSSSHCSARASAIAAGAWPKPVSTEPVSPLASPMKSNPMLPNPNACRTWRTVTGLPAAGVPSGLRTVRVADPIRWP